MLAHVRHCLPAEACGIVGGKGNHGNVALAVDNDLKSSFRYKMNPQQLIHCMRTLKEESLDLVGLYHSHPCGAPSPSQRDINDYHYPDAVMLIWSVNKCGWELKGFKYISGYFSQVPIGIVTG